MKTQSLNKRITPARTRWSSLICLLLLLGCLAQRQVRADTYVCGVVMGTWTKANSPYVLTCDVLVADLVIEPGVTVSASNYTFEVAGILTAIGTQNEPIVFKARNPVVGWQGIFFNYSSPGTEMRYCIVSNSVNRGVRITKSVPYFEHCTIANNTSSGNGGGIFVDIADQGDLLFRYCTITSNNSRASGGGIAAWMSANTLILECCQIEGNTANPSGEAGSYLGGGIYISGGLRMRNCLIADNKVRGGLRGVYAEGGGVYSQGRAEINNCIIRGNYAAAGDMDGYAYGGGMTIDTGPLTVANSVFLYNTSSGWRGSYGGGLYLEHFHQSCSVAGV